MNNRNPYMNDIAAMDMESGGALFVCGLWLRLGFVGATVAFTGIVALFGGDATPLPALAMAVGGAALAVLGWRRAYLAVDSTGRSEKSTAGVGSADMRTAAGA